MMEKKIIVETVVEKVRPTQPKKREEAPWETLWEHPEHIFSPEDNRPPDKWGFQEPRKK